MGNIVVMKEGWTDEGYDLMGLEDDEIHRIKAMASDLSWGRIKDADVQEAENEETESAD